MVKTVSLATAGLALSLASTAVADNLIERTVSGSKVLGINFYKEQRDAYNVEVGRRRLEGKTLLRRTPLEKRATALQTLDNAQQLYYANVSLGTPLQTVRLQIDTGSSDVWVNSANSQYCQQSPSPCNVGAFNEQKSSTFKIVDQGDFNISYVDGTGASGDYFTDNFKVGGVTIKNQQMGIATDTDIPAGIMGVGYDVNEAILAYQSTPYPSVIDQLQAQGFTNTKAYSLWLNDLDSNTGSVLFGGIDTKKYQGSLTGLPIQKNKRSGTYSDFTVVLSSISYTSSSGKVTNINIDNTPVILDSGSTLMYLPDSAADAVAKAVGASYVRSQKTYYANCNIASNSAGVNVGFGGNGGPTIFVDLTELLIPAQTKSGAPATDNNGNPICTFGIQRSDGQDVLFGDAFLRSAYVVYDLTGNQLYIAQTVFNTTDSDVREITSSGVPDVSGVASGAVASNTNTGVRGPTGVVTGTSKAGSPGTSAPEFFFLLPITMILSAAMLAGGAFLL